MTNEENNEINSEFDFTPKIITPEEILSSCARNQLYSIPELNDTLFLHYGGYNRIASLEPYVNLTSLWLNNNSIGVIEGLSTLKNLVCLYLNGNVIRKIEGLDELVNLETLCLSNNYIRKIEHLSNLKKLHTLELDHNQIAEPENFQEVQSLPVLGNLNLSFNRIESEGFLPIFAQLKQLALLKLEGNPVARTMSQYRRKILFRIPSLTYLDDSPVNELDIRCAKAYMEGGSTAEMEERRRYRQEKEDEKTRNRRELRRANRKFAIEQGIDISNDKYLMSSDDERLQSSESSSSSSDDDEIKRIKRLKQQEEERFLANCKVNAHAINIEDDQEIIIHRDQFNNESIIETSLLEEESSSSSSEHITPEKRNEHGRINEPTDEDDII